MVTTIKLTNADKELPNNTYEIWCDNALPIEAMIAKKDGNMIYAWLSKAEYILPLDKYKAVYKGYWNK